MTGSQAASETRTTSVVVRVLLGVLAVSEAVIGGWALFAPASFYQVFRQSGTPGFRCFRRTTSILFVTSARSAWHWR